MIRSKAYRLASLFISFTIILTLFAPFLAGNASAATDPRYFSQTGFRIDNDKFWDYFTHRGGVSTFGYPISRTFTFLGKTVQLFQRRMVEINPDGGVGQLNLLDSLMPYNSFNYAVFPPVDPNLVRSAPAVGSPNYGQTVLAFVQAHAPNNINGMPVNFYNTFLGTVSLAQAYPNGGGSPGLLRGIDLEMWGVPISQPAADPHNHNFIYLRFQRGIMHYDNLTHTTQGILTADYFKSILTGQNLPGDLAVEAAGSPYFKQYDNSKPNGVSNPALLPNTNLKNAFVREMPQVPTINGLRYGFNVWMPGQNQQFIVNAVNNAGYGWIRQQIRWADIEPTRGNIQWNVLDPIVNAANQNGLRVAFTIVTAPTWTRAAGGIDGPPDNDNDLGDFVAALASRYDGEVQAYEIWNEENFSREWGGQPINPGAYVEMLKVAHERIKAVDPSITVISGALTPTGVNDPNVAVDDTIYLNEMYQYKNGLFKSVADAVGVHAAGYNNPPQDWVDSHSYLAPCYSNTGQSLGTTNCFKGNGQFYFRRIDQIHQVMTSNGDNRQAWITELEWGAATPPVPAGYEWTLGLTEGQVGDFFVQAIKMIQQSRPWVGAIFVWNLNWRLFANPHTNESALFGVLNADGSSRSIYTKLAITQK